MLGERIENSRRQAVIIKAREGYHAYRRMLHYYAMKNLLAYLAANREATRQTMCNALAGPRQRHWVNLGGQLVPERDVTALRRRIKSGELASWNDIHGACDQMWEAYELQKQRHAHAVLLELVGAETLSAEAWQQALDEAPATQEYVREQVYLTRKKDYDDPFRRITFADEAEMRAVVGTAEDNSFVKQVREDTEAFAELVDSVRARG